MLLPCMPAPSPNPTMKSVQPKPTCPPLLCSYPAPRPCTSSHTCAAGCGMQALQAVCPDLATASSLPLPEHYMRRFFLAALCVDLHHNAEALQHLQV